MHLFLWETERLYVAPILQRPSWRCRMGTWKWGGTCHHLLLHMSRCFFSPPSFLLLAVFSCSSWISLGRSLLLRLCSLFWSYFCMWVLWDSFCFMNYLSNYFVLVRTLDLCIMFLIHKCYWLLWSKLMLLQTVVLSHSLTLSSGGWQQRRRLPGHLHNFQMLQGFWNPGSPWEDAGRYSQ